MVLTTTFVLPKAKSKETDLLQGKQQISAFTLICNVLNYRVVHPDSGRVLEVYSNQPGVQFYTSNYFPDNPATFKGDKSKLTTLEGKGGAKYYKHGAFCLETQVWPDAPNHVRNFLTKVNCFFQ